MNLARGLDVQVPSAHFKAPGVVGVQRVACAPGAAGAEAGMQGLTLPFGTALKLLSYL